MEDMRAYEALWPEPVRGFYRNFEIVGPGAPGTGGSEVIAALARLEPFRLRDLGHYSESADALYELLSATRARHLERTIGGHHSDAVIAIDKEGNVATVVHTINTDAWGTTGLFVDGISIPDIGAWAQRRIAEAGPGGRLSAVTGSLGGSRRGRLSVTRGVCGVRRARSEVTDAVRSPENRGTAFREGVTARIRRFFGRSAGER